VAQIRAKHARRRLQARFGRAPDRATLRAVNASQLTLVVGTLEFMDKCQADNVIARLSGLYSMALYAAVPIGCSWQGQISYWNYQELIAYGLQLVRQYSVESKPLYLYHYDMYDYKL
jgi:hypothetical protein